MTTVAYAILVLAGAILFGAATVTEAIKPYQGMGSTCGTLGVILGIIGFIGCVVKPLWDAVPVSGKKDEAKKE